MQPSEPTRPPEENQPKDAAYWAVSRNVLRGSNVPAEAVNLNVEGRRVAGALQASGSSGRRRIGYASPVLT